MGSILSYRHRASIAVVVVAALAMVLSACSSSSKSSTGTSSAAATTAAGTASSSAAAGGKQCSNIPAGPIKAANIVPLGGPTATSGELAQTTSTIIVDYFNANNSICGHPIQLITENDKGDPATSLSLARQLVSQGVSIVVNDDGALALFDPKTNPTAFSFGPSNAQYAQTMVDWAKSHNDNNIGIISDGTSFSVELAADAGADP